MNTVTKAARYAASLVGGGTKELTAKKRAAHKVSRATAREACKQCKLDPEFDVEGYCNNPRHVVDFRDIA